MSKTGGREKKVRKPPTRKRKPAPPAPDPKSMGGIEYKKLKLDEIRTDLDYCRKQGRVTAMSQLHRLELQLHDEMREALLAQDDPSATLSSQELLAFILETILEMPQSVQDQIAATLEAVRTGAIVKLGAPPTGKKKRTGGSSS